MHAPVVKVSLSDLAELYRLRQMQFTPRWFGSFAEIEREKNDCVAVAALEAGGPM